MGWRIHSVPLLLQLLKDYNLFCARNVLYAHACERAQARNVGYMDTDCANEALDSLADLCRPEAQCITFNASSSGWHTSLSRIQISLNA